MMDSRKVVDEWVVLIRIWVGSLGSNGAAASQINPAMVTSRESSKGARAFRQQPNCLAAWRVFFISMAMVMGPTPPGTGVMAEQSGATSS